MLSQIEIIKELKKRDGWVDIKELKGDKVYYKVSQLERFGLVDTEKDILGRITYVKYKNRQEHKETN